MTDISRRHFLGAAVAGTLTLDAIARTPGSGTLPKRPLGTTGLSVTILGLGCATIGFGGHSVPEGARIVEACIDGGVNYIDCASTYGNAEEKVGEVMRSRRKEVILTTKTLKRGKEESWEEINRSLERLRTDHVDLLQVHAVNAMADLDRIRSADGALWSAIRAKEEGLCTHLGITGHTRPEVIAAALDVYPFETTLVPLSSTDALLNDFGPVIFPLAARRGFGVIAMKVLAAGKMTDHPQESIRYSMTLPVSTAIVGMGSVREVEQNIAIASAFTPMTERNMEELRKKTRGTANESVMWWKRT